MVKRYQDMSDAHGRSVQRKWFASKIETQQISGAVWSTEGRRWHNQDAIDRIYAPTEDLADDLLRELAEVEYAAGDGDALAKFTAYPPSVAGMISMIRTDLDAFSPAEIALLENHGYLECSRVLIASHEAGRPPLGYRPCPVTLPHPEWGPTARPMKDFMSALQDSHRTYWFGRYVPPSSPVRRSLLRLVDRLGKSAPV
jgi:hypothetical protein